MNEPVDDDAVRLECNGGNSVHHVNIPRDATVLCSFLPTRYLKRDHGAPIIVYTVKQR